MSTAIEKRQKERRRRRQKYIFKKNYTSQTMSHNFQLDDYCVLGTKWTIVYKWTRLVSDCG